MKKILAIGNSFSEDATKYLHQIAAAAGVDAKVVNLYIGKCPLERHWDNIEQNAAIYQYQINGLITERECSIEEVVLEDAWDYIILQQVSFDSGWVDSYEPFMELMLDWLRERAPKAEFVIHETWAYEIDSKHPNFIRYKRDQKLMFEQLKGAYAAVAKRYGLRLIPCGQVVQATRACDPFRYEGGGMTLCRDGHHMTLVYGRYLLALVWAKVLLDIDPLKDTYVPETIVAEPADPKIIEQVRGFAARFTEQALMA